MTVSRTAPGDPFVRSQRMILVFLALISSLFFSALFYNPQMQPICTDAANKSTCKLFRCPTCLSLLGDQTCGDDAFASPLEVCQNFLGTAEFSAHRACTDRPLSVCRTGTGTADEAFFRAAHAGRCADPATAEPGDFFTIAESYVRPDTGETVLTGCVEYAPDLLQTIGKSLLTALCTVPVLLMLQAAFDWLRKPTHRAVAGDWQTVVTGERCAGCKRRCLPLARVLPFC